MRTFDGLIREYPAFGVDHFRVRRNIRAFLLSHVHRDHLNGLENEAVNAPIYCSEITALLLPELRSKRNVAEATEAQGIQRRYAHVKRLLRPLPLFQAIDIDLGEDGQVSLTLLPTNHCPGAVMFLIRGGQGSVLYTGDFRAEAQFMDEIRNDGRLLGSSSTQQTPSSTTCSTTTKDASESLCIQDTPLSVIKTLQNFPLNNGALKRSSALLMPILLEPYSTSICGRLDFEEHWVQIASARHTKIHVSQYTYDLYTKTLGYVMPSVASILTTDPKTLFHSCHWNASPCRQYKWHVVKVRPSAMWWKGRDRCQDDPTSRRKGVWKLYEDCINLRCLGSEDGKRNLDFVNLFFAMHSSLNELKGFVELL
ncbi:hypothetical protein BZG36_04370 [Bifiguratus adelaidae]|uniref:Metallo-beta-lactamase domain-containing protein n=1 Tax=Bifiguratus adelaidae TaxID=1938954 RepID=A0A261XVX4_9FUNG|nr:hypothetical protein BZG36_04370 [Bifiguratus adelaidae]